MHRDKKTGLALGVLLVGIVGAFFFRNEADPNSDIPELEDSKILDDRIAERSVAPYLTGVETEQDEPAEPRSRGLSDDELPSFLREGDQGDFGSPPDPIREQGVAGDDTSGRGASTDSDHNHAWQVSPRDNTRPEQGNADNAQFHVVKQGDTLSALAAKYLGSTRRFLDLYNANTDILKSADDLRVGMKLRIPARSASRQPRARNDGDVISPISESRTTDPPTRRDTNPEAESRSSKTTLKGLFSPAVNPHRSGSSRRRLTQTPPDDVPSIDDDTESENSDDAVDETPQQYTIKSGDSLERIAVRHYGTRSAVQRIFEANRQRLRSPNDLRPGMTIILP